MSPQRVKTSGLGLGPPYRPRWNAAPCATAGISPRAPALLPDLLPPGSRDLGGVGDVPVPVSWTIGRHKHQAAFRLSHASRTRSAVRHRTDAESLQTPGPSLCDRSQHPSELLDIIGLIAAVQHRVTVWADRDQIGFRVHRVRGSHSVQRTLVVDVNEALARFAVPLLETQVAYRASQTMMVDAGVTRLGVPLVAIHCHSLDIPFLVDILLAQLTDCCWLIRWGQARKGWAGKRWQSALGFVTLFFREQVPKACIQSAPFEVPLPRA